MLTSGVAFGNKAGNLSVLTNLKCWSCLSYKLSPLSDNCNKMHNYNSKLSTFECLFAQNPLRHDR
jgi:hypothetical protein